MKYIFIILLIILASALGYYSGQLFYKEKINISTNDSTSKPLISPLIEEKKFTLNVQKTEPVVIVPEVKDESLSKDKNIKTTTILKNTTSTTSTTLTTSPLTEFQTTSTTIENSKENNQIENNENQDKILNEDKNPNEDKTLNQITTTDQENQNYIYYIQVGAYLSIENAQSVKKELENLGLNPKIEKVITGGNIIYRIIIGYYKTEEEANQESNKLKRLGFDNIVRSNQ